MGYMERFQVDGQWMAEDELAPFVSQVKEAAEKVEEKTNLTVTVFEMETAIAFLYFREKQCDYVVLEAGMGGLLDATNVIDTTVLSIFASISMDHIGVLGNTLEEIAENKAGIIKPSCQAVVTAETVCDPNFTGKDRRMWLPDPDCASGKGKSEKRIDGWSDFFL